MIEQKSHFRTLACLYSSLLAHFGQRTDVYVAAQTPLHYAEQQPDLHKQPDIMVFTDLRDNHERERIHLWTESTVPSVVIEITSQATWLEDLVNKSALYLRLGIKEYLIFDPYDEFLKEGLQGLRLVKDEYVPIALNAKGMLVSQELGANLLRQGPLLRLVHPETEQMIPWGAELAGVQGEGASPPVQVSQELEQRLTEEAQRAQKEAERAARESKRAQALEAENAHLRVLLGQMQTAPHR
ncbi:MAG: Uma2 family endonuclease [Caldilineaceae bacterium]